MLYALRLDLASAKAAWARLRAEAEAEGRSIDDAELRRRRPPTYWRETGTSDVKLAAEIRDRWADEIVRHENNLPTAVSRPVMEFVEDFLTARRRRTNPVGEQHLRQLEQHLIEFVERSGVTTIPEITPDIVNQTLADIKLHPKPKAKPGGRTERHREALRAKAEAEGKPLPADPPVTLSAASVNHRLTTLRSFFVWLQNNRVVTWNPAKLIEKQKCRAIRPGGALTKEEAWKLIDETASLPFRHHHTGRERQAIYAMALGTSLRLGELRSLRVRSLFLDDENPHLEMVTAKVKEQEGMKRWIAVPMVPIIRAAFEGRGPTELLFPKLTKDFAADMLRADLKALGIPTTDEHGSRNFKALRATASSVAQNNGLAKELAQQFLGHKSIKTTDQHYSKIQAVKVAAGVNQIWNRGSIPVAQPVQSKATQSAPTQPEAGEESLSSPAGNAEDSQALASQSAPKELREVESHQRDLNPQHPDYKDDGDRSPPDPNSGPRIGFRQPTENPVPFALRNNVNPKGTEASGDIKTPSGGPGVDADANAASAHHMSPPESAHEHADLSAIAAAADAAHTLGSDALRRLAADAVDAPTDTTEGEPA